jgi:hypothetical protein
MPLNISALRWWNVPGPGVPNAISPGFSLASFTRSATEWIGRAGLTTSTNGTRAKSAIGVSCVRGS